MLNYQHLTQVYAHLSSGYSTNKKPGWSGGDVNGTEKSSNRHSPPLLSVSALFPRRVENPGRPGPDHLGGDGGGAAAGLSDACPQADVGTRGKNGQTRKIQISRRFGRFFGLF